jgi:hypothetical protein
MNKRSNAMTDRERILKVFIQAAAAVLVEGLNQYPRDARRAIAAGLEGGAIVELRFRPNPFDLRAVATDAEGGETELFCVVDPPEN